MFPKFRHSEPYLDPDTPSETFARLRRAMVERQLRRRGISDQRVLEAMLQVPREHFVSSHLQDGAYNDCAQPIGHEQTISQPYTVAYMCEAARLRGDDKVLEVGTGSGYGAAVLAMLAREVFSIERIAPLARLAETRLKQLGYDNVTVFEGDGSLGLPEHAPFDAIVVTAAAVELPPAYKKQIADGGRIVIPIGDACYGQTMYRFTREGEDLLAEDMGGFAFVPLIGQYREENDTQEDDTK